jgi:hypothetical protein
MPDGQNKAAPQTGKQKSVKERQAAILAQRDHYERLRRVFESPDGGIILQWLHSTASTGKPRFRPGDGYDPNRAAYRDGRASLVLEIEANLRDANATHGAADPTSKPGVSGKDSTPARKRGRKASDK